MKKFSIYEESTYRKAYQNYENAANVAETDEAEAFAADLYETAIAILLAACEFGEDWAAEEAVAQYVEYEGNIASAIENGMDAHEEDIEFATAIREALIEGGFDEELEENSLEMMQDFWAEVA